MPAKNENAFLVFKRNLIKKAKLTGLAKYCQCFNLRLSLFITSFCPFVCFMEIMYLKFVYRNRQESIVFVTVRQEKITSRICIEY